MLLFQRTGAMPIIAEHWAAGWRKAASDANPEKPSGPLRRISPDVTRLEAPDGRCAPKKIDGADLTGVSVRHFGAIVHFQSLWVTLLGSSNATDCPYTSLHVTIGFHYSRLIPFRAVLNRHRVACRDSSIRRDPTRPTLTVPLNGLDVRLDTAWLLQTVGTHTQLTIGKNAHLLRHWQGYVS